MTFWRIGPDVISNRRTAYVGLYSILTFCSPQIISIRFESIRPIRFAYTHGRNPGGGRERGRVRRAPSQNMCAPLPSARTPVDVKRCQNVTVSLHRDWRHWWVMSDARSCVVIVTVVSAAVIRPSIGGLADRRQQLGLVQSNRTFRFLGKPNRFAKWIESRIGMLYYYLSRI